MEHSTSPYEITRGFEITPEGKLVFTSVFPHMRVVIPEAVVAQGADAVEKHIVTLLEELKKLEEEQHRVRRERYERIRVPLSTEYEGTVLTGELAGVRYGTWRITLLNPVIPKSVTTLYNAKYDRLFKQELMTEELEPTAYALVKGKNSLVSMYREYVHRESYKTIYMVLEALKHRKEVRRKS